jgi:hypothetical protein
MWRGGSRGELWVGGGDCEEGLGVEGWNEGGWFTWGGSRDDWVVLTWKYYMIYLPPPSSDLPSFDFRVCKMLRSHHPTFLIPPMLS